MSRRSQLAVRWNDGGAIFTAAVQAAQATTVGLAQNYTGIGIVNPNGSGIAAEILTIGFAPTTNPAANSAVGIMGGVLASTDVPGTAGFGATTFTTLTAQANIVGGANAQPKAATAICTAFRACNQLSTAPVLLEAFAAVTQLNTNGGLTQMGYLIPLMARWTLSPGGWLCLYTSTTLTGFWSLSWGEASA